MTRSILQPTAIMTAVHPVLQRQLALGCFAAIWAVKLSHLLSATSDPTAGGLGPGHLGLWLVMDTALLLTLKLCQVPRLHARGIGMTLLLILSAWCVDLGVLGAANALWSPRNGSSSMTNHQSLFKTDPDLATPSLFSAAGLFFKYHPFTQGWQGIPVEDGTADSASHHASVQELAQASLQETLQSKVVVGKIDIFNESFIKGSHIVNIKPPVQAKLNPNATYFCVSSSGSASIALPILIKGLPPFVISYQRKGLEYPSSIDNHEKHLETFENITIGHDVIDKKRMTAIYTIPITEPGVYALSHFAELGSSEPGQIISSPAVNVVPCPTAHWEDHYSNVCLGTDVELPVSVSGVGPFMVWVSKHIAGLPASVFAHEISSKDGHKHDENSLSFMHLHHVFRFPMQEASLHEYQILRVQDGLNNTVDFSSSVKAKTKHRQQVTSLPDPDPKSSFVAQDPTSCGGEGCLTMVQGRSLPSIQFKDCDSVRIRSDGQSNVVLPVTVRGNGPWNVDFMSTNFQSNQLSIVKGDELRISKAGKYELLSVSDQFCRGIVQEPAVCIVTPSYPPTVQISSSPINSFCVGAIGAEVNVSFIGNPPFWLTYSVTHVESGSVKVVNATSAHPHHTFYFEPKTPGSYRYDFVAVGDVSYPEGVTVSPSSSVHQTVHAKPSAEFLGDLVRIQCMGEGHPIKVRVNGEGPLFLEYEMMHEKEKKTYQLETMGPEVVLHLGPFDLSGLYVLSLTQIADKNGCKQVLETNDMSIEVLSQHPMVSFASSSSVHVLQGQNAMLPLSVRGRKPFHIRYVEMSTPSEVLEVSGDVQALKVPAPGTYMLLGMNDAVCQGLVGVVNTISTTEIPKPFTSFDSSQYQQKEDEGVYIRQPICMGAVNDAVLHIHGSEPFELSVKHESPVSGKSLESENIKLSSTDSQVYLKLDASSVGNHRYSVSSISDQNYVAPVAHPRFEIHQRVLARPSARFVNATSKKVQCITEIDALSLPIELTGQGPFNVAINILSDHRKSTAQTVKFSVDQDSDTPVIFEFRPPNLEGPGTYTFSIDRVVDSTGCDADILGSSSLHRSFSLVVTESAKIEPFHAPVVCVGDLLSYKLQGSAPYVVDYTWNGATNSITVFDSILVFFAASHGVLSIGRVCNSLKCCLKFDQGSMVSEVKPLPKATVDGGENVIDDIREGDESVINVQLSGTPPFSFTWSRTAITADGNHNQRHTTTAEETFTVSDITTHSWSLSTVQDGLFQVTSVTDQFCAYPRPIQNVAAANVVLGHK